MKSRRSWEYKSRFFKISLLVTAIAFATAVVLLVFWGVYIGLYSHSLLPYTSFFSEVVYKSILAMIPCCIIAVGIGAWREMYLIWKS